MPFKDITKSCLYFSLLHTISYYFPYIIHSDFSLLTSTRIWQHPQPNPHRIRSFLDLWISFCFINEFICVIFSDPTYRWCHICLWVTSPRMKISRSIQVVANGKSTGSYKSGPWVLLVWVLVWFGFCLIIIRSQRSVIEHLGRWVGSEWDRHIFSAPKSYCL